MDELIWIASIKKVLRMPTDYSIQEIYIKLKQDQQKDWFKFINIYLEAWQISPVKSEKAIFQKEDSDLQMRYI